MDIGEEREEAWNGPSRNSVECQLSCTLPKHGVEVSCGSNTVLRDSRRLQQSPAS